MNSHFFTVRYLGWREALSVTSSLVAFLFLSACPVVQANCLPPESVQNVRPDEVYIDNYDGTVRDVQFGLIWKKCSVGQNWLENTPNDASDDQCVGSASVLRWDEALAAAKTANEQIENGVADWRLPNVTELQALVDTACVNPAINVSLFPAAAGGVYWTSSPYVNNGNSAWSVSFYDGVVSAADKTFGNYVRLVRRGL